MLSCRLSRLAWLYSPRVSTVVVGTKHLWGHCSELPVHHSHKAPSFYSINLKKIHGHLLVRVQKKKAWGLKGINSSHALFVSTNWIFLTGVSIQLCIFPSWEGGGSLAMWPLGICSSEHHLQRLLCRPWLSCWAVFQLFKAASKAWHWSDSLWGRGTSSSSGFSPGL